MDINGRVRDLRGVGEKNEKLLNKLGIATLNDLIHYLPKDYLDLTRPVALKDAAPGEFACVRAIVAAEPSLSFIRRNFSVLKVKLRDGTGEGEAVFYNQPYLKPRFEREGEMLFYGRAQRQGRRAVFANPGFEKGTAPDRPILPVYGLTAGLSQKAMRKLMAGAVAEISLPETMLAPLRARYGLCEINYAIKCAHFPAGMHELELARRRLVFEELLLFLAITDVLTKARSSAPAISGRLDEFLSLLPFKATNAQIRVMREIESDLASGRQSSRLIQGDVGCGKTAVALYAMYCAAKAGFQSAMMAPTELLACQHYETACRLFSGAGVKTALITGSLKASEKTAVRRLVSGGECDIVIGTHALLYDVSFTKLGLVITDEQHRFGVAQREKLGAGPGVHTLIMSATPIPRTLAMIMYGGTDISAIDELPAGRKIARTRVIPSSKRLNMYGFIHAEALKDKAAYVVCPLIEPGEAARSAKEVYSEISASMEGVNVALLHGRMKAAEKADVMERFRVGEISVLVSTTVVEVGVDVSRATIMAVENAERFGLSTLHQLRGRVGRGGGMSWCFLISESQSARERLNILARTDDGFEIAEQDLMLRGPGEFMGRRQNGVADLYMRSLMTNMGTLNQAREALALIRGPGFELQNELIMQAARARFGANLAV